MSFLSRTTPVTLRLSLATALLLASMPAAAQTELDQFFQPDKIRALIISGRNNHDWRSTTPFLKKVLTDTGRFDVRVIDEPSALSLEALLPYHVLVMNYCGPRLGPEAEHGILSAVRSGRGFVVVHGATYTFGELEVLGDRHRRTGIREEPWSEYIDMIGATWVKGPPKTGHGDRHVFEVKLADVSHPIIDGMDKSFFISDELYADMRMKDGLNILGTAFSAKSTRGTGEEEPMLWTLNYGEGRVFHTALGHDLAAMDAPGFITTFARGTEWAATGEVTLPAGIGAEPAKENPIRVKVVIGGHDFAPSFYKLFDGKADIAAMVVDQPDAYEGNRLLGVDVVVQYDMMQPISEAARSKLRGYLENGGGLVVLHHALASYQDWDWWAKEVVGARYNLGEGPSASTYEHDVELHTVTVGEHPLVRGVPPMRIVDETYKNMWFSPGINVLIQTDHPTSDGPLAWISPYEKARVAVIQLGHGPEAHNHEHFQRLVHNAILWTSGRGE